MVCTRLFLSPICLAITSGCQHARYGCSHGRGVAGWFLKVGVLAFCADGEVKAHEWSANDYDDYDPALVADRLVRSRALTGATTCERLHALEPATCERCPFWGRINSPIAIPFQHGNTAVLQRSDNIVHGADMQATLPSDEIDTLPEGFTIHDGKLWAVTEDKNGPIEALDYTHGTVNLVNQMAGLIGVIDDGDRMLRRKQGD
jgi:hypothetical protein